MTKQIAFPAVATNNGDSNIYCIYRINYSDLVGRAQENYLQTQHTVCTLFKCVCAGDKHVCCHRSGNGLGAASSRENIQRGRVQCLVHGDGLRFFLRVRSQEQDFPVQVSMLHKHLAS